MTAAAGAGTTTPYCLIDVQAGRIWWADDPRKAIREGDVVTLGEGRVAVVHWSVAAPETSGCRALLGVTVFGDQPAGPVPSPA